jgi:16S rRNA (uracil1498-N3)-methyltransferase
MHRSTFFIEPMAPDQDRTYIRGEEFTHLHRVLRLQTGADVRLIDGQGGEYRARISRMAPNQAEVTITARDMAPPSRLYLRLFQAVPRSKKMDMIVQKLTEIGVQEVIPVISEHALVESRSEAKWQERLGRWQKIALEACKQSGRAVLPVIGQPLDFAAAVAKMRRSDEKMILWEREQAVSFREILATSPRGRQVAILIGPEGGFSAPEIALAREAGLVAVSLGRLILRTETAAMVAAAIVQFAWGDL